MPAITALIMLVAVVALALVMTYVSRQRGLKQRVGSFIAIYQPTAGKRIQGVAHYGVRNLEWYRLRSLAVRPAHRWQRSALGVHMHPDRLADGSLLVECHCGAERFTLILSPGAYAGLRGWLEAGPSGSTPPG